MDSEGLAGRTGIIVVCSKVSKLVVAVFFFFLLHHLFGLQKKARPHCLWSLACFHWSTESPTFSTAMHLQYSLTVTFTARQ